MVSMMAQQKSSTYVLATGRSDRERLDILDDIYGAESRSFLDRRVLPGHALDVVVDVGCGHGHMLRFLAGRLPDAEVIGVDQDPAQVSQARSRTEISELRNAAAHEIGRGPSLTGRVDLVYSRFVLMHQPDRGAYVHFLRGLGHPGSLAVFEEPCLGNLVTYPYASALHRANELTIALGESKGIRYDVGPGIFDEVGGTYTVVDAHVSQPMLRTIREKSIVPLSFAQIRGELDARRIASIGATDKLCADLWAFARDASAFCTGLRVFHVLGVARSREDFNDGVPYE
jgi:SAM-dependent methyltransferase